ncbi:tape measure protein [Acinetobacter baumannii]|nr:tape measure protein [Acinetobacter baumannii]
MAQESRLVIVIDAKNAERNARNLSNELDSIERKGDFATKSMDALSVATRQLAGYMAGLVTVSAAISKMDTYTGLQNRLKLVTSSQVELNQALKDTFNIAQVTGQAWDSTAQVYQRFADNAKRLGITLQQTSSLTETVAKAIAISGGSAASAEAALVQFGQALASGVLRGEEFNSIAEQAPGLLKAIATGLDTNIGQLRGMAAEGKLTADVVVKSLERAKVSVDELFGKTDFTIGNSLTMLNNSITQFIGEAGKGSGAAQALSGSIQVLANNLDLIANSAFAMGIGLMTKAVLTKTVAVKASIAASAQQVIANIAERNANIAAAKAEVESALAEAQSTQVTLTNIKATHAQIMAEIELEKVRLKAQITEQGRTATITRMAQLGRLQAQVALEVAAAETAQSASSARLSAALTAQSVATSRLALAKSALMAIFSPMGLAIAATAASFYLLSSSSDEVKESLATQSDSVSDLTDKYIKLNTVQALTEGVRLRKEIEQQNDAIDDASGAIKRFAYIQKELFKLSGSDYEDYQNAIKSIATGASDAGDLLKKMISSGRFSQTQIDKLIEFSSAVAESKNKIEQGNTALKLLNATSGQHVEVTAESIKQLTIQTNLTKVATQNFTDMKTQMLDSLRAQVEFIRLNGGSEEQVKSLNKVIQAYSLNQISATDAVDKFNSTAKVPAENIKGLQDYATKTDQSKIALNQANAELKKQNDLRNEYLKQHQTVLGAQQGETNELNNQVAAQEKLNKLRENANKSMLDDQYWINNYMRNKQLLGEAKAKDFADFTLNWRKENNIGREVILSKEQLQILQEQWQMHLRVAAIRDEATNATKEQNKALRQQAVLLAGNNERVRNMLRVYQAFRNAGLGDKQARVMTAQVGRETDFRNEAMFGSHKDENNGYTNTGFLSWQKSRSTKLMQSLQGQGVLDKNGKIQQTQDALDAMAKHAVQEAMTDKSYSKSKAALLNDDLDYRSLERIVAKNLVGWDYDGKKLGKAKASQHLAKQDSYYNQLSKILGDNPEAASKAIGDLSKFEDEAYKARAKTLEEVKQLQATYDSETVARSKKREEEINKATILGQTDLIPKIKERFDAEEKLAQKQFDFEVNGYKWTEEQKLEYTKETSALRLVAEGKLSKEQLDIAKEGLDQQYQHELELINLTKAARQSAYDQANLKALQELKQERDILAAPIGQRAGLSLQFGERNALSENDATLINKGDEAKMKLKQKEIDQLEYNKRIEDAVRIHEENKFKIQEEYAQKYQDLQKGQYESQLQIWSSLLNQGQSVWSNLTQSVKDASGEQSKRYKTMFAMQQAFAIASTIVSAHLAAAQTTADITLPFVGKVPAASAILGFGYAQAGMIAAQTIAGFSDGGYTGNGLKHTPAGIVHKGEVVWSQDDIKRWGGVSVVESMRTSSPSGYANGGYVSNNTSEAIAARREARQFDAISSGRIEKSQPTVTIINQTSEKVDATSEWDGKELTVILKEYQKQNEAMVDAKIEKRFRMSKRQGW